MRAARAVTCGTGALFLLELLAISPGCGPHGVRKVKPGQNEDAGEEESGGSGGTGGGTGGMSGRGGSGGTGGTGGSALPDAGRDLPADMAMVMPDTAPDLPPDMSAMEAPPPDVMGAPCATSTGAWVNNPFPAQNGMFTVRFEGTSSSAPADTVMGLSNGAATGFTNLAVIVRFGLSGNIDARNGGAYAAAAAIPYAANMTYQFRLQVNVGNHTYSAWVTPPGGQERLLGMNYAFRTEQNTVTSLNSWAVQTDAPNTARLCGFAVQ